MTGAGVKFECDQCRQRIETPGDMLGSEIVCPKCGKRLTVPKPAAGAEPAVASPKATPPASGARGEPETATPARVSIRALVPQLIVAGGLVCLLLGLLLVSRRATPVLYLPLFLLALACGALACREKLPALGATLALATLIAPFFARPRAAPVQPFAASPPLSDLSPMRAPLVAPPPEPESRPTWPDSAETPFVASEPSPAPEHSYGPAPAPSPEIVAEPDPEPPPPRRLSPTFSDDPFRDVFGPPPDSEEGVAEAQAPDPALAPDSDEAATPDEADDTVMLESDRICRDLLRTPDDPVLLTRLRNEIGTIANEEKRIRLMAAYGLGVLRIGRTEEARKVHAYLQRHYPAHRFTAMLSPERTMRDCAACSGQGSVQAACPVCKGDVACTGCEGTGQRKLTALDGASRTVACGRCAGSGKCRRCKGEGRIESVCPTCRGTRKSLAEAAVERNYRALLAGDALP